MEFKGDQAIYMQIAEYVCDQILAGHWPEANKALSIRELSILMEVTPNTVQRTYDFLQRKNILINKRGVGYFPADNSKDLVLEFRRELFFETQLPSMLRSMFFLGIKIEDVEIRFKQFINNHK